MSSSSRGKQFLSLLLSLLLSLQRGVPRLIRENTSFLDLNQPLEPFRKKQFRSLRRGVSSFAKLPLKGRDCLNFILGLARG